MTSSAAPIPPAPSSPRAPPPTPQDLPSASSSPQLALTVGRPSRLSSSVEARGFYASASVDYVGLLMAMNFAFTGGKYNGSTLTIITGRSEVFTEVERCLSWWRDLFGGLRAMLRRGPTWSTSPLEML
ncbi:hypothetical protein J5N97_029813 [Dioscorea zingiberensis]|uniref:Dirigent protein n=1 Tax=Dioscorea zingiberensis TaxID=325984 RepID=A0A9D5BWJ5_9LILI|nr:hypothetical protein J5N97_029813 [Dioscorea zingiberensis]